MTLPVTVTGPEIAEAVYSENIWITCVALGYPLPVVTWFKDSAEISATYDDRCSDPIRIHNAKPF